MSADELLDAALQAVQDDVDANELASDDAEAALDLRLDAPRSTRPGAAVTVVQDDVDQNEADADAATLPWTSVWMPSKPTRPRPRLCGSPD